MYVDFKSLKDFDVGSLIASYDAWSELADQFTVQVDDYQRSVVDPVNDGTWTGAASAAAQQDVGQTHDKLVATQQYFGTVLDALAAAIDGMRTAQSWLEDALALATNNGLSIDGNGNVDLGSPGGMIDWYAPPVVIAMRVQKMIYEARFMAYTVDQNVCPVLRYAQEFHPDDNGPWQADADSNTTSAGQVRSGLPGQLRQYQTPEPPVPPDTSAQTYHDEGPDAKDIWTLDQLNYLVLPGLTAKGDYHAAAALANWMANTGTWFAVDPTEMMNALPTFSGEVLSIFSGNGDGVWQTSTAEYGGVANPRWLPGDVGDPVESDDWYYTLHDFRYRVVGLTMTDEQGVPHSEYTVGIKKPYVYGPNIQVGDPPQTTGHRNTINYRNIIVIPQADMEHLHRAGFTQNFIVQGISHTSTP